MWIVHGKSHRSNNVLPCQGRLPRRKYINMWPSASKSSRRDCSTKEETTCTFYINREKKKNLQKKSTTQKKNNVTEDFPRQILGKKWKKHEKVLKEILTFSHMRADAHVTRSASEGLVFTVRNVTLWAAKKDKNQTFEQETRFLRRHGQIFLTVIKFHKIMPPPRLISKENTDGSPSFRHTWVSGSIYSLAKPKSTTWIHPCFLLDWL